METLGVMRNRMRKAAKIIGEITYSHNRTWVVMRTGLHPSDTQRSKEIFTALEQEFPLREVLRDHQDIGNFSVKRCKK